MKVVVKEGRALKELKGVRTISFEEDGSALLTFEKGGLSKNNYFNINDSDIYVFQTKDIHLITVDEISSILEEGDSLESQNRK